MTELAKKKKRGQLQAVYGVTVAVIGIAVLLVVGAVLLAQLATINTNSLGNNSNASLMIGDMFALLFTTQGIIVLVVVVALLAVALAFLLGAFGAGARGGGR